MKHWVFYSRYFAICYNYSENHRIGMTNIYVILLVLKILWCDVFFAVSVLRAGDAIKSFYYTFDNSGSFPFLWYFILRWFAFAKNDFVLPLNGKLRWHRRQKYQTSFRWSHFCKESKHQKLKHFGCQRREIAAFVSSLAEQRQSIAGIKNARRVCTHRAWIAIPLIASIGDAEEQQSN